MPQKRLYFFLFVGFPLAICFWLLLLYAVAGYSHESQKVKILIFTIFIVIIFQFIIADPIKFLIQAIYAAYIQKEPPSNVYRHGLPHPEIEHDDIRFLKMRIDWGKSRLQYNWRHRDEGLNLYYRNVAQDLWQYLRYFILLIMLIVILNEPLRFHYGEGLRRVLSEARLNQKAIENLETIHEFYDYLENVIVGSFQESSPQNDSYFDEVGWMHHEMGKILGVARIMQVRFKNKFLGLQDRVFTKENFMPNWVSPYKDLPYKEKYWRTYKPWVPTVNPSWLNNFGSLTRIGYLSNYPDDSGYITLLARTKENSKIVLNFLKEQEWVDQFTAALFIDFTLYSPGANIFAMVHIVLEITPFGHIIHYTQVESEKLLLNWDHVSHWYWLVLLLFIFHLIEFCRILVLKAWYGAAGSFNNIWNILDCVIVFSNICAFICIYIREEMVISLIKNFEETPKLQYINFRPAILLTGLCEFFLAILVCIATVRLWKLLLFARVFRLFIRTLELGAVDIFWALLNITIFLIGLTISSYMINGSYRTISHTPLSFVHIFSFSLGYSERSSPMEKSQAKNSALGLIIYALIMFGVTLILVNMLITLVCIHFAKAKEEERLRGKPKISFWQFLKVEYSYSFHYLNELFLILKKKLNKPVIAQIGKKINEVESMLGVHKKKLDEDKSSNIAEKHANRMRRLRIMTDILLTQTRIIQRRLQDLDIKVKDNDEKLDKKME